MFVSKSVKKHFPLLATFDAHSKHIVVLSRWTRLFLLAPLSLSVARIALSLICPRYQFIWLAVATHIMMEPICIWCGRSWESSQWQQGDHRRQEGRQRLRTARAKEEEKNGTETRQGAPNSIKTMWLLDKKFRWFVLLISLAASDVSIFS